MTSSSKPPHIDRVGEGTDFLRADAAAPMLVGFLRLTGFRTIALHNGQPAVVSPASSGLPQFDFHAVANRKLWVTFAAEPKVGEEVLVHHISDRGADIPPFQLRVMPTFVDSNNAETRYRGQRGEVVDHRNVRGQFFVRGWGII